MACFIVPMTEAVVTTVITKVIEKRETKEDSIVCSGQEHEMTDAAGYVGKREHFSAKLKRLNGFLWGGSALLAFEHLWHGEISPAFPFLTAAGDAEAMKEVLHEMSTVGVGMAALVTGVWAVVTGVTVLAEKRAAQVDAEPEAVTDSESEV